MRGGGRRGGGNRGGGGNRRRRGPPRRGGRPPQEGRPAIGSGGALIDLTVEDDYLLEDNSDDSSSEEEEEFDSNQPKTSNSTSDKKVVKTYASGKQQFFEQNRHRFEMNSEVLTWTLEDLQTPIELDLVPDHFRDMKHYSASFLDYIFEETRACINQSLETNNHGDMAKCSVVKWKKGKNRGDSATVYFDIIPRPPKDPNMTPYIPMFQKHDYCVVTTEPSLQNLDNQNHFFCIIEEGNQLSSNKFQQQSQPWSRRHGGRGGRRGRGGRGGRGGRDRPSKPMSNIKTSFKAKFHASTVTKHLLNMDATARKGRKQKHKRQSNGPRQNWFVFPIFTMVTKHREYEAIQKSAIPAPLFQVLKGEKSYSKKAQPTGQNIAPPLREYLMKSYNSSQFRAIDQVLNLDERVQCIHGPPGTGKTSVLLGLIMALLANKKRILICSGTNVAVDHIVAKLSQNGLRNSNGEKYQLSINKMARIGNDEKIDELSKRIDPATRFKQLQRGVKDIIHCVELIRKELFEVMEKSRQSNTAFNARNSIRGRTEKVIKLIKNTEETITKLLLTKLINQDMVNTVSEKFSKVTEHIQTFLEFGNNNEAKKIDLNNGAKDVYEEIDSFYKELQVYLVVDNRDVEKKILDNCDLVFATLAITGRHLMRTCKAFDIIIIDEAAQVTESESVIPLDLATEKLVLIGDPKQLPSTVISNEAVEKNYNRSMFERLMKLANTKGFSIHKPVLLDTQYRMHPKISRFPEHQFYHSVLKDGENVKQYDVHTEWKPIYELGLEPCLFMHCPKSVETFNPQLKSYNNEEEANTIVKIIDMYMTKYGISRSKIAVITFYRAQVDLIREKLTEYEKKNPQPIKVVTPQVKVVPQEKPAEQETQEKPAATGDGTSEEISIEDLLPVDDSDSDEEEEIVEEEWFDVNTVDSYQGSEKQVVILSTVRANDRNSLGFCVDQRRLNVAITRAQFSLVIVGNGENLCYNDLYREFIKNTKVVEPRDFFQLENEAEESDNMLLRNLNRNSLNLTSALLNNKAMVTGLGQDLETISNKIIDLSLDKDNHILLFQAFKTLNVNFKRTFQHGNNLYHRAIYSRSFDCALELLKNPKSHSLLFDLNQQKNLPIHSLVLEYGKRKPYEKEKMKTVFENMITVLLEQKPTAIQKQVLEIDSEDPYEVFDVPSGIEQTIDVTIVKQDLDDLLEIMVKHDLLPEDEDLELMSKGLKCERFFKPPPPVIVNNVQQQVNQQQQQIGGKRQPHKHQSNNNNKQQIQGNNSRPPSSSNQGIPQPQQQQPNNKYQHNNNRQQQTQPKNAQPQHQQHQQKPQHQHNNRQQQTQPKNAPPQPQPQQQQQQVFVKKTDSNQSHQRHAQSAQPQHQNRQHFSKKPEAVPQQKPQNQPSNNTTNNGPVNYQAQYEQFKQLMQAKFSTTDQTVPTTSSNTPPPQQSIPSSHPFANYKKKQGGGNGRPSNNNQSSK